MMFSDFWSDGGFRGRTGHIHWGIVAAIVHVWTWCVPMQLAGAPIHHVHIDGTFEDWLTVPSYADPADDQHDTDHDGQSETPGHVDHPDVDILEYKFTHDDQNLYAYFRATGDIGATQAASSGNGRAGRYYVIVTIDVDNEDSTGYWLHEGGYYPTSQGYDMNMEIEYYDGAFNTGHYINHGALSEEDIPTLEDDQKQGIVDVLPGTYDYYTQWVMFEDSVTGDHDLGDGTSITFVSDKGPVYLGNITAALSPDGRQLEMVAPFIGFMSYPGENPGERGDPIMQLGRTLDISFSLEASGELQTPPGDDGQWASDTAEPIVGYYLDSVVLGDMDTDGDIDFDDIDDFVLGLNDAATYTAMYGAPPATYGDADSDGDLDFDDIAGFVTLLNVPLAAAPQQIPEPSTIALAFIALPAIPFRRVRSFLIKSCRRIKLRVFENRPLQTVLRVLQEERCLIATLRRITAGRFISC